MLEGAVYDYDVDTVPEHDLEELWDLLEVYTRQPLDSGWCKRTHFFLSFVLSIDVFIIFFLVSLWVDWDPDSQQLPADGDVETTDGDMMDVYGQESESGKEAGDTKGDGGSGDGEDDDEDDDDDDDDDDESDDDVDGEGEDKGQDTGGEGEREEVEDALGQAGGNGEEESSTNSAMQEDPSGKCTTTFVVPQIL